MSSVAFVLAAVVILAGALAAASMRKLIHAALSLVVTFVGVASLYFLLGAEFVGLVQIFVYVGAVAVLIVFTILLTRRDTPAQGGFRGIGVLIAAAVFAGLVWAIFRTPSLSVHANPVEQLTVGQIGSVLMTDYVWPLQCVGLVLTAAMLGALVLVMEEKP